MNTERTIYSVVMTHKNGRRVGGDVDPDGPKTMRFGTRKEALAATEGAYLWGVPAEVKCETVPARLACRWGVV